MDERKRLEALYRYEILDTLPEQAFDDIARLSALICGAPIGLISFTDPNRSWFKASYGLMIKEIDRKLSFCQYTIQAPRLLIIENALNDERFVNNPFVKAAPDIRFYAGAPLITSNEEIIGTICAISDKPSQLNDEQKKSLQALANLVMNLLDVRLNSASAKKIEESQFLITKSVSKAPKGS